MKRLIYVIVTCILFSIFAHAKRTIPRALELDPNYFHLQQFTMQTVSLLTNFMAMIGKVVMLHYVLLPLQKEIPSGFHSI